MNSACESDSRQLSGSWGDAVLEGSGELRCIDRHHGFVLQLKPDQDVPVTSELRWDAAV